MTKKQNDELYLNAIIKEEMYPSKGNLQFHLKTLFEGINFENKRVLDIGGGSGLHSLYAAYRGAKEVVCLEPEAEGSCPGANEKFRKLSRNLELNNVTLEPITIQDFEPEGKRFDIILLQNSINHLDETACINLLKDESSKTTYKKIFSKISSLSNSGAKLIVCDCSRYNLFALLRIKNPFARRIEWQKHQSPEVWANLLSEVGFVNPNIRWTSFNRLRHWGKVIIGNKLISYFLISHFCLTMYKA